MCTMIGTITDHSSNIDNYSHNFNTLTKVIRDTMLKGGVKIPPRTRTNTFRGLTTIRLFSDYLNGKTSFIEFIYYFNEYSASRFNQELSISKNRYSRSERIIILESFKKLEKQALDYDYIEVLDLKNLSASTVATIIREFNLLIQNILAAINQIIYGEITLTENFKSYRHLKIIQLGTTSQKMIEKLEKQTYDKFVYHKI